MKHLLFFIFSILLFSACSNDDFDVLTEEELPFEPKEVEIEDAISFRTGQSPTRITQGLGYKAEVGRLVASEAVEVECPGGLATRWEGEDYFLHIFFIKTDEGYFLIEARFDAEIDGQKKSVFLRVPGECLEGIPETLTIEQDDDERLAGRLSGEFFRINTDFVGEITDTNRCDFFISVGELEASFDVPVVCQ